ncbi:VOC family protein [Nitrospirillum pindoramense]|uniref:3-demethylubiquinone-9 3-methyltransferase n=1 Tax=Nitrospirillum amazonense TaxID=28077 RepID=A0A560H1I3_9PROT|nr:3-demethylubiquinone-9 3-methyltransferase [Nitrospirillum amazonense]
MKVVLSGRARAGLCAIALYIARDNKDRAFAILSEGGGVLMPLAAYPFGPRFAWLGDRFGVSWQVRLV